jgi:ABC-2 type transport system ATP-binding protein/lipopolysaccharide transport system ATP-binding protein
MTTAIEVHNVSKRYQLGQRLGRYRTLREVIDSALRRGGPPPEYLWALRDVSFEVEQGGTLGLIGPNGAGKTTLLKVLARITEPTAGVSRTRGRAGALLDVGTGFHPELTGKENVYLNAAILGMSRRDVRKRFDEIVDFSGLERFLETPLKRYSWGMYLRLAFAVAAHVEPEVVIVDEVLAVGDLRFREKCLVKMSEFGREGRTVVFVSHDLGSITQVCRRAIWLEHGGIAADGPSEEVVRRYVRGAEGMVAAAEFAPDDARRVQLLSVAVTDQDDNVLDPPQTGEPLTLFVRFVVREPVPAVDISISVYDRRGLPVFEEVWGVDTGGTLVVDTAPQEFAARLTVPPLLPAGDYVLTVWLGSAYDTLLHEEALRFRVWPRPEDSTHVVERDRIVQPAVEWDLSPLTPEAAEPGAARTPE